MKDMLMCPFFFHGNMDITHLITNCRRVPVAHGQFEFCLFVVWGRGSSAANALFSVLRCGIFPCGRLCCWTLPALPHFVLY